MTWKIASCPFRSQPKNVSLTTPKTQLRFNFRPQFRLKSWLCLSWRLEGHYTSGQQNNHTRCVTWLSAALIVQREKYCPGLLLVWTSFQLLTGVLGVYLDVKRRSTFTRIPSVCSFSTNAKHVVDWMEVPGKFSLTDWGTSGRLRCESLDCSEIILAAWTVVGSVFCFYLFALAQQDKYPTDSLIFRFEQSEVLGHSAGVVNSWLACKWSLKILLHPLVFCAALCLAFAGRFLPAIRNCNL